MNVEALIAALIFCVVVGLLVWLGVWVIRQTIPGPWQTPLLAVLGVVALVIILYRLAPTLGSVGP